MQPTHMNLSHVHRGCGDIVRIVQETHGEGYGYTVQLTEIKKRRPTIDIIAGLSGWDSTRCLNVGDVLFTFFDHIKINEPTLGELALCNFALRRPEWRDADELELSLIEEHGPLHTHLLRWAQAVEQDHWHLVGYISVLGLLVSLLNEELTRDGEWVGEDDIWILNRAGVREIKEWLTDLSAKTPRILGLTSLEETLVTIKGLEAKFRKVE